MFSTNPVSIGKVDSYGGRGILIATQHSGTDGISSNTLYLRLAESGIDRRMIFKPLGISTNGLCTLCCLKVLVFHNTLPRSFQCQRVTIYLNESVDEVYPTLVFRHPFDTVVVEQA